MIVKIDFLYNISIEDHSYKTCHSNRILTSFLSKHGPVRLEIFNLYLFYKLENFSNMYFPESISENGLGGLGGPLTKLAKPELYKLKFFVCYSEFFKNGYEIKITDFTFIKI